MTIRVKDLVTTLPVEEAVKKELQGLITRNEWIYFTVGICLGALYEFVYLKI